MNPQSSSEPMFRELRGGSTSRCLPRFLAWVPVQHLPRFLASFLIQLLLRLPAPRFVRKQALSMLFERTVEAFGSPAPDIRGLSYRESLSRYAEFTREQVESRLSSGMDIGLLVNRLHQSAFELGSVLKHMLMVRTGKDAMTAARSLYRMIEIDFTIDFTAGPTGEFRIRKCFFSERYHHRVCRVISALDSGLISGLSGCGGLHFTRRITEGARSCGGYMK